MAGGITGAGVVSNNRKKFGRPLTLSVVEAVTEKQLLMTGGVTVIVVQLIKSTDRCATNEAGVVVAQVRIESVLDAVTDNTPRVAEQDGRLGGTTGGGTTVGVLRRKKLTCPVELVVDATTV